MSLIILLSLFFLVPLTEIYLLLQVGDWLGVWTTIGLVVGTAVLGAFLVRAQGFSTYRRVQQNLAQGQIPAVEMMEGVALVIAGALLMTPGFFTDTIGFILLTPPLRRLMIRYGLRNRVVIQTPNGPRPTSGPTRTVEGEYRKID